MDYISIENKSQTGLTQPSEKRRKIIKSRSNKLPKSLRLKNQFKRRNIHPKGEGVIYVGHIPHGFYEDEMKSYFSQFGKVLSTAVSRSLKTGRSRGYGFVQFQDEEVAKIAAETMNNYLMFSKILKCRYIPPEERKKNVSEGKISTSNYPRQHNRKIVFKNKTKAFSQMDQATYLKKVHEKINEFKTYFEKNGIDFTFKINDGGDADVKNETETSNSDNETGNEADEINGTLEIDESDNEISFNTPPKVKKVIKKSLNPLAINKKNSISSNNSKIKRIKKTNSKRINMNKQERYNKKTKLALPKLTEIEKKEAGENLEKMKERKGVLKKILKSKRDKKSAFKSSSDKTSKKSQKLKKF